jgi:ribonuclease HI
MKRSGVDILLETKEGLVIQVSLRFNFTTTNNQSPEYEACLTGLRLTVEMGDQEVILPSESQVIISEINGEE